MPGPLPDSKGTWGHSFVPLLTGRGSSGARWGGWFTMEGKAAPVSRPGSRGNGEAPPGLFSPAPSNGPGWDGDESDCPVSASGSRWLVVVEATPRPGHWLQLCLSVTSPRVSKPLLLTCESAPSELAPGCLGLTLSPPDNCGLFPQLCQLGRAPSLRFLAEEKPGGVREFFLP